MIFFGTYLCFLISSIPFFESLYSRSVSVRNKVITGLLVFQGLETRILKRLTVGCVDISKGKIHIPGTGKTEPKVYGLRSEQLHDLKKYLWEDRPVLQKKINNHSDALFPLNSTRFGIITSGVLKVLKTLNYKVTNIHQIRASVIALWVQGEDLRLAQKKARHRFISSTEKYRKYDPNVNRNAADVFHLMK